MNCSKCASLIDPNGELICFDCIDVPTPCSGCNRPVKKFGLLIGEEGYCSDCAALYAACIACKKLSLKNRLFHSMDGLVCSDCIHSPLFRKIQVVRCLACQEFVTEEDYSGKYQRCRRCAIASPPIKNYNADVLDYCRSWYVGANGGLDSSEAPLPNLTYFGVELEVELAGEVAYASSKIAETALNAIKHLPNFAIAKSDSSLSRGFEIVSAPATLQAHKKKWDEFFSWLEKEPNSPIDSFNTGTCGMHVHIGRANLSSMQIGKMIQFIYNPKNRNFMRTVAQRESDYAEVTSKRTIKDGTAERQSMYRSAAIDSPSLRRTALNTIPNHTVELRIFKGTTSRDVFFANLEFCKALVDFCAPGVTSIEKAAHWEFFCNFVHDNGWHYRYLHKFLANKSLVPRVMKDRTRRSP